MISCSPRYMRGRVVGQMSTGSSGNARGEQGKKRNETRDRWRKRGGLFTVDADDSAGRR